MELDRIDRGLLTLVQAQFPLVRQPYHELGRQLGIDETEVIRRIDDLKKSGIIRQISAVIDGRRFGYRPTLVAMRVNEVERDRAEELIGQHPGVSHGYERDHYFNIWFTLSVSRKSDTKAELAQLASAIKPEAVFELPALKVFKIGAYFDMDGDGQGKADMQPPTVKPLAGVIELSQQDRLIIRELQEDLPLVPLPFARMAASVALDDEHFLERCRSFLQHDIIRRYAAAVNHRKAGFTANAMVCWAAAPELVDAAGQKLSELREVSHCYERKTNPLWQYNLFAMMHSHTSEECYQVADRMSETTGLAERAVLFSTREFKKTRVKYLV